MILNKEQASAALTAMRSLAAVGGFADCTFGLVSVLHYESGCVHVQNDLVLEENYVGVAEFAAAYGLESAS